MKSNIICIIILTETLFSGVLGYARSSYGEVCNKTQRCDTSSWLGCFEGICKCVKGEEMRFDPENNKCLTKVGEICKLSLGELFQTTECVEHADCNSDGFCHCGSRYHEAENGSCALSSSYGEKCSDIDKCSKYESLKCCEGICVCDEGYIEDRKNKICAKNRGSGCIFNRECIDDLECIDRRCSCPMPNHQEFSEVHKACITQVEGHCTNHTICVPDATCDKIKWQCQCKAGFIANHAGRCEIAFGQNCSDSTLCDSIASLSCVNQLCACPNKMSTYSPSLRKCLGLVGARCEEKKDCAENSECSTGRGTNGTCRCPDGFVQFQDHTCQREKRNTHSQW